MGLLLGAVDQTYKDFGNRKSGLIKGERLPVAEIAFRNARSMLRKYLDMENTTREVQQREEIEVAPGDLDDTDNQGADQQAQDTGLVAFMSSSQSVSGTREVFASDRSEDDTDATVPGGATAVPLHGGSTYGGYETAAITERRMNRSRGSPPGMGQGSIRMARRADVGVELPEAPHFITRNPCVLLEAPGYEIIVPRTSWQRQRFINHAWRALRGDAWPSRVVSLLDPNAEKLESVPGTFIRRSSPLSMFTFTRRNQAA